jgi:hypothetical protein
MPAATITSATLLAKSKRQIWASIELHDRAVKFIQAGAIIHGFRAERAAERCRILANSNLHLATRLAHLA